MQNAATLPLLSRVVDVGVREASQPQPVRPPQAPGAHHYDNLVLFIVPLVSVQYESCRLFYFLVPGSP